MKPKEKLGRCGVYCGQCRAYTTELADMAILFKKYIIQDYSWLKESDETFDYENFLRGLDWFTESTCPGCRESAESWCDVKKCTKIKENTVDNCLLCQEFPTCSHTEYQRGRYSYLFNHIETINQKGFKEFLEEEEKRAQQGVKIQKIRDY